MTWKNKQCLLQSGRDWEKGKEQNVSPKNCTGGRDRPWGKHRPTKMFTETTCKDLLELLQIRVVLRGVICCRTQWKNKGEMFVEGLSSSWSHLQVNFPLKQNSKGPHGIGTSFKMYLFKEILVAFPVPYFDPHTSWHMRPSKKTPVVKVQFFCRFNFLLCIYFAPYPRDKEGWESLLKGKNGHSMES